MTSDYLFTRSYRGKVKAVILDWSGTVADAYVLAPAVVFVEMPEIRERWKGIHGSDPDQGDVDRMFADFVPMQLDCLRQYTAVLPGVAEAVQKLQKSGVKIGSTTGFVRSMVDILEEDAKKQGYVPDASVAGDEVVHGARPKPFMVYKNLDMLDVHPIQSVVKVDDTVSGVGEALEAGCWGVGVSRYSNYMDIDSLDQADRLPAAEIGRRHEITRDILRKAGAHYVIDSVADLPAVVDDINARLARGERP